MLPLSTNDSADGYVPTQPTLDEPIRDTLLRDVRQVGRKLKCVLLPSKTAPATELRDCTFFAPRCPRTRAGDLCATLAASGSNVGT